MTRTNSDTTNASKTRNRAGVTTPTSNAAKSPRTRKQTRAIAYHEAGHAVVSVLRGVDFKRVTLSPPCVVFDEQRTDLQDDAVVYMAGPVAEAMYRRVGSWLDTKGWDKDIEDAEECAKVALKYQRLPEHAKKRVVQWVGLRGDEAKAALEFAWSAVERVVKALEEERELSQADVVRLVFGPMPEG